MSSLGDVADWAQLDPDFVAGKKALSVDDWNGAITALKLAALRDPQNADIQNYIGYAYRRLRHLELALAHYQQALVLNSRHRSAHEHLGEAYLIKGNLDKAESTSLRCKTFASFLARNTMICRGQSLPSKASRRGESMWQPVANGSRPTR